MGVVGVALDLLLNALAGSVQKDAVANPGRFIPTWAEAEARYTSDKAGFEKMLDDYCRTVRTRTGDALLLTVGHNHDAQIAGAKTFFQTRNKPLTLAAADVHNLGFRLVIKGRTGLDDTREAWKMIDGGAAELATAMTTRAKAMLTLKQLRRLDDVCIRWMAAAYASAESDILVSEILALYRAEGNLQVPASTASIEMGVPTESLTEPSHITPCSVRSGVSVQDKAATHGTLWSTAEWMLQLAGLDHVTVNLTRDATGKNVSVNDFKTNFRDWSLQNWSVHKPAGDPSATGTAALQRWNFVESLISVHYGLIDPATGQRTLQPALPGAGLDAALVATVDDPVVFVGTVLAEGAMFLRRLATPEDVLGAIPASHPLAGERLGTQIYGAFSYNLHMGNVMKKAPYNRPHNAHREAGLTSAIAAAQRSQHNNAKPLSTLINGDSIFRTEVKAFKVTDDTDATKATEWPIVQAWLLDIAHAERFDAVVQFIEKADIGQWGSWQPFRGHASRYRRLLRFYERVVEGP